MKYSEIGYNEKHAECPARMSISQAAAVKCWLSLHSSKVRSMMGISAMLASLLMHLGNRIPTV
jgi:hypothetical protein